MAKLFLFQLVVILGIKFLYRVKQVDGFLDSLVNYDKENIPDSCLKAIEPYLNNSEFDPSFIKSKSVAAAGLCSWAINIVA